MEARSPVDQFGIDSAWLEAAKADNSAVFVGSDCSLLSARKAYRIAYNDEILDWDRLSDSP
jgi:hypothetical protein